MQKINSQLISKLEKEISPTSTEENVWAIGAARWALTYRQYAHEG
ncbi:hypothetical protein QEJ31_08885 [Pigmentibacter sp. JX0631]|nr:hypothetical protein [Pigmentibacter sp. JX0631]WGL58649.1 hypothetical protein QEJ31_08885 [Pigmentibacter sp. JX0631]